MKTREEKKWELMRQVLAADPYSESADDRVKNRVTEVIPGSEVVSALVNDRGDAGGQLRSYALFWAELATVRDFNLLYRIS